MITKLQWKIKCALQQIKADEYKRSLDFTLYLLKKQTNYIKSEKELPYISDKYDFKQDVKEIK